MLVQQCQKGVLGERHQKIHQARAGKSEVDVGRRFEDVERIRDARDGHPLGPFFLGPLGKGLRGLFPCRSEECDSDEMLGAVGGAKWKRLVRDEKVVLSR